MKNPATAVLDRIKLSAPWALRHLILSIAIASGVALLVIKFWFPAPFFEISGGLSLFVLIVIVDVVCGPALTLLLLHPGKTRKALWVDVLLISTVQISALFYGIYVLSEARPIAVVFEVDRFRVVSYADLDTARSKDFPGWISPWGFASPRTLSVRSARTPDEKWASVEASLQGVEPSQRPDWWQDYDLSAHQIKARAKPLGLLLSMHPQEREHIQAFASQAAKAPREQEVAHPEELLWLPVVSRQSMDWVAFIDPKSTRIRGYANVDGFGS